MTLVKSAGIKTVKLSESELTASFIAGLVRRALDSDAPIKIKSHGLKGMVETEEPSSDFTVSVLTTLIVCAKSIEVSTSEINGVSFLESVVIHL